MNFTYFCKVMAKKMLIYFMAIIYTCVFAGIIFLGFAYIAMLCWNMFCPYVKLPEITFWQMWAFMCFLSLIFNTAKVNVEVNKR